MGITLGHSTPEPLSRQIVRQLAAQVAARRLRHGRILPGERTLAEQLGVSRDVVRHAYKQLTAAGVIETWGWQGKRVCAPLADPLSRARDRRRAHAARRTSQAPETR